MSDKKKYEAVNKYNKEKTKTYCLRLNLKNDREIIERLGEVSSVNGYIKELIRVDILRDHSID